MIRLILYIMDNTHIPTKRTLTHTKTKYNPTRIRENN